MKMYNVDTGMLRILVWRDNLPFYMSTLKYGGKLSLGSLLTKYGQVFEGDYLTQPSAGFHSAPPQPPMQYTVILDCTWDRCWLVEITFLPVSTKVGWKILSTVSANQICLVFEGDCVAWPAAGFLLRPFISPIAIHCNSVGLIVTKHLFLLTDLPS